MSVQVEQSKGTPWLLLGVMVLWAFMIGLVTSDTIMEWLGTPRTLRTIAAEYLKAAERKEKVAKFYEELNKP